MKRSSLVNLGAKPNKSLQKIGMNYNYQQEQNEHGSIFDLESLYAYLSSVADTRLASARGSFDAHPKAALEMLISAHFPTL